MERGESGNEKAKEASILCSAWEMQVFGLTSKAASITMAAGSRD